MTEAARRAPPSWRANLLLFLATLTSVFLTGGIGELHDDGTTPETFFGKVVAVLHLVARTFTTREALTSGAQFAGTVLTILVAHEFGHYIAARIHKVDASLPYFIPMPLLSPFGTMGAVIRMRGNIPTRRALLDIGAAGPLAGLVFALPLYAWGTAHSHVVEASDLGAGSMMLGESVVLKLLDRLFGPTIPEGMDLALSPVAFGAWGGMFVTMINLLPIGQLDGGHVAYALFGPKQDRYAQLVHRAMLVFFFVVIFGHAARDVRAGFGLYYLGRHIANAMFWLVWFQVLAVLGSLANRKQEDTDDDKPANLSIRTRALVTGGLLVVASLARDNHSALYVVTFFAGLGVLIAMEIKGGVLRKHDLLDHPSTGSAPLDKTRAAIAICTLAFFVLLFMPEPFRF